MGNAETPADLRRIATGLLSVFWGILVIVVDFTFGLDEVRIDLVNDLVGAALVIGGVVAVGTASVGVAVGPWFGIAIAGGVASLASAAGDHHAAFDNAFPVLAFGLQLVELVGLVAFCIGMSRLVVAFGWLDLAYHWRLCAWVIGAVHAVALGEVLLVKASGSEVGEVSLVLVALVAAIGTLVFLLSCIWRTASRCRRSRPWAGSEGTRLAA